MLDISTLKVGDKIKYNPADQEALLYIPATGLGLKRGAMAEVIEIEKETVFPDVLLRFDITPYMVYTEKYWCSAITDMFDNTDAPDMKERIEKFKKKWSKGETK